MKFSSYRPAISVVSVLLFLLLWEVLCSLFSIREIVLPRPSQVFTTLLVRFPDIARHLGQTLGTTVVGFVLGSLLGGLAGAALGWSRSAYAAIYPILAGVYSIPKAAFVPILVLWFGAGAVPAILAALIGALLPVAVNVANGVSTLEPEMQDTMIALRARRQDMMRYLAIPRSLPTFGASLKVSFSLALVGSVVSEMAASNQGLGNVMMIAIASYDTPLAFAALALLSGVGMLAFALLSGLERRLAFWAHREQMLALA